MSLKALLILVTAMLSSAHADSPVSTPEPPSFRIDDYHAAVPATVDGHPALTTKQVVDLWHSHGTVFIDTLPQPPRPVGLPADTIWRPKIRYDIPGSIWLPDTGYGELAAITERYFENGLDVATSSDRSRHIVFYCLANCWMSWNATRRARALGYSNVDWYAEGTDGWAALNLPLEAREPVPRVSD